MRRAGSRVLALALVAVGGLPGCKSDPIESDVPSSIVTQCCAEAQERIATINDVATDDFRDRCNACRRGNSKQECAAAVVKLHGTIENAYGEFSMPMSCTRMKEALRDQGIDL